LRALHLQEVNFPFDCGLSDLKRRISRLGLRCVFARK
jgi:hypothetical protein